MPWSTPHSSRSARGFDRATPRPNDESLRSNTQTQRNPSFKPVQMINGKEGKRKGAHHFTLVSDGWTNIHGESIVDYVLVSPDGQALYHKGIRRMGTVTRVGEVESRISSTPFAPIQYRTCPPSEPLSTRTSIPTRSDAMHISSTSQSRTSWTFPTARRR